MNSLADLINPQVVLIIGAIAVSSLLLRLLFQILQAGFGSMISLLIIVLVLYYGFDVSPRHLWFEIIHLPQDLAQWIRSLT